MSITNVTTRVIIVVISISISISISIITMHPEKVVEHGGDGNLMIGSIGDAESMEGTIIIIIIIITTIITIITIIIKK